MAAKLTLFPPQRASRFVVLRDGETLVVGRDAGCGLLLDEPRISKQHARLQWQESSWLLEDLGSKNGTSVNGQPARGAPLRHGDWLSFGGLMARFEHLSEADRLGLENQRLARLQTSSDLRRRLSADLEPIDLLLRFLESAIEVSGAERGFVLVAGPDGRLRVEVAAGFRLEHLADERFAGSLGVVGRAVETGAPVILSDAQADPFLAQRPSVIQLGIGAVACVPLRAEERLLGVLYVDSRTPGAGFSGLDVEVLESLAEHTALVIAGLQVDLRIRHLLRPGSGAPGDPRLVEELQRRLERLAPGAGRAGTAV